VDEGCLEGGCLWIMWCYVVFNMTRDRKPRDRSVTVAVSIGRDGITMKYVCMYVQITMTR
jgi:hypothetical protein